MFSSFIAFSQSYTLSSTFQTHQPDFNYNPQLDFSISERINTQADFISTTITEQSKSTRTYFRSIVKTKDSLFKDCYAFGVGLTMGSGGAFYLSVSNFDASNTKFESNNALNGGALSLMAGNLLVSSSTFKNNMAYENGGSIYVTSSSYGLFTEIDENIDKAVKFENKPSVYISDNTKFTSNSANNYGGAIFTRSVKEIIVKNCIFEQNQVQLAGSAIFLDSTPSNIINNKFNSNVCKSKQIQTETTSIFKQRMFTTAIQANGGAICLYCTTKPTGILTDQNKFDKNAVSGTYSYLMNVPTDISFAGNAEIQWISSGECHMSYNLDYPQLIASIKFLDCYSVSPFTNITEKGLGTPSVVNQHFQNQNYDDRTSFTPNSLPSMATPNPEEEKVEVKSVSSIFSNQFENFIIVSISPATPSRSLVVFNPPTTNSDGKFTKTKTIVKSEYFSETNTRSIVLTRTTTLSDNSYYYVSTYVEIDVVIPVIVETSVEIEVFVEESNDDDAAKDKKTKIYIAVGATVGFLIIITLILIFIIAKIRNNDDDNSSTSELFIQSQAPKISQSMTTTSVTVDNPLFSTTVDQDDPFKLEFDSSSTIDEVACENDKLTISDSDVNNSKLEEL